MLYPFIGTAGLRRSRIAQIDILHTEAMTARKMPAIVKPSPAETGSQYGGLVRKLQSATVTAKSAMTALRRRLDFTMTPISRPSATKAEP
jgi:hypothetical protein